MSSDVESVSGIRPTFQSEVMLAGWKETHTGGATITFWLPNSEDLEVFRGLTVRKGNTAGHRFACVLVEIGDDEAPKAPSGPGPLCQWAVLRCREPAFHTFLANRYGIPIRNESDAREALLELCDIQTRRDLDTNPSASAIFHEAIRKPYSALMAEANA